MRFIFWALVLFFLTIFQAGFLAELFGDAIHINLVFLVALSASLLRTKKDAFILGAIAGFFLDVFSGYFFGLNILTISLTCLFSCVVLKTVFSRLNALVLASSGVFMTFLYYGLFSFFSWLSVGFGGKVWIFFLKENAVFLIGQLALNAFLFSGIFYFIKHINVKLTARRFSNF